MNKELDKQLCQSYPRLYRGRYGDIKSTLMCWGFGCGDGWYTLLDVISGLLTKHNPEICVVQVKEKFGGLRFYHSGCDAYSLGVEMTAGTLSHYICEICGAPGLLNDNDGWWSTRCDAHASENLTVDNRDDVDIDSVADLHLGAAWSRLAAILKNSAAWHTEHNGRPAVTFCISKTNGRLVINSSNDDEFTNGMVDIIAGYANRIDEYSGMVINE
ncbi:MAG: hypothetical protein Q8L79_13525 [Methylobacter sp.]|uniref:hypothetical protein n=1 Tax=Methylobacter sp. TaxID=2051955 RepID=UPI00272F684B|nr:hypothetical protein [Methylobacter sp.]MDP1666126.1 hypothetical protein [Methylobacter sp.]